MKKKKSYLLISSTMISLLSLLGNNVYAEQLPERAPQGLSNSGVQLNQTLKYLENQRIAKQIEEDRNKNMSKVKENEQQKNENSNSDLKFKLTKVIFSDSSLLSADELTSIESEYEGKDISINDLYNIVDKVNELYKNYGYITCKAVLEPQHIKNGVVHISLIEGRTGNIDIVGNNSTNTSYIMDRLSIKHDGITNINELNKDLLWFNATNDVQLQISMQSGDEPNTTDYVITAKEPKQNLFNLYVDNSGSETTGELREGLFYTNNSLTGKRDSLNISTMFSSGTDSISAMYQFPIDNKGMKLGVSYSTNNVNITDGELSALDVEGSSSAIGLSLTKPLKITETSRSQLDFSYMHQTSQTDFLDIPWVDDTTNDYIVSYSNTHYGQNDVFYQKYSFCMGNTVDIKNTDTSYTKYMYNSIYQKAFSNGQSINFRFDGQWSGIDYLPSAEQFYIGGFNSVRGYKESILSGDNGFFTSIEYSFPLAKKGATSLFTFLDYGQVTGASAFDDNTLASTGFGIKSTIKDRIYLSLTYGLPLITDLNGTSVSSSRLHFMLNCQF